ncbi:hypothetical protein PRIPAC_75166 [Pristionchus pacificus]|uniref:G protein-coupled receptor n=1 Tax=Pristionchus pacificus TaxID=54126 RepID=A0A2A6C695_PRIPA|nr:hypothetical protein PRIPAC_75166 [Pristionchus pacificus]|eukprot:PDM73732.1 G protein-coupled receptor [Pristionchus pacificus]
MGNVTLLPDQLPQYFQWDRNFAMEFSYNFRFYYCVTALFTIHPLVFYILIFEPGSLSKEIRLGYIANQASSVVNSELRLYSITLIIFEWVYGVLFGIYPLCPYPGIHCGGWLCGKGIHPRLLLTFFGVCVILPSPPFEYLLLVMHQKLVQNTTSKANKCSCRTQNALIVAVTLLLSLNIIGFGIFGVQTKKADEILSRPELAWLAERDGEVFLFGDIADPESFTIGIESYPECYILAATVGLIGFYVWFFSYHTIKMLKTTENSFTDETMRIQMRMITVLQYQFYGVFLCFAIPCGMMFLGVYFGTMGFPHPRTMAFCRPVFTVSLHIFFRFGHVQTAIIQSSILLITKTLHNLDSLPLSLIFLLKNQTYRRDLTIKDKGKIVQILWNKVRRLVRWLTPCVDRSVAPTLTSFRPFSSMPSSSMTRSNASLLLSLGHRIWNGSYSYVSFYHLPDFTPLHFAHPYSELLLSVIRKANSSLRFQTCYCIIAIFTIHPLVFYLLFFESASLSKEIRLGYLANQAYFLRFGIGLIIFEWVYGVFIKVYPLCPYPGIHCGGLLCGKGIPPQILLAIVAFGVVIPDPPFEFLLLVMHQKLVQNTPSKVRFKKRTQFLMMVAVVALLGMNVVGFAIFGQRTKKADEILSLVSKGGEVFLFGDIAEPEGFAYECYILSASIGLIMLFIVFFSYHTISTIKSMQVASENMGNTVTDETMRLQVRMINVLRYQFYGVAVCMALPCGLMFLGVYFGTLGIPHPRYMATCRFLFSMIQIVDAVPLSLIFLLKNQTYRRVILDKTRRLLHRLTPCIGRTVVPISTPLAPFSSFPSSSITRPNDLPYYFNYDVDFAVDLTQKIQTYYCITALFTIHPIVLYLLIWESRSLSEEVRRGYIAHQVSVIMFEWIYGVIIQIYPLCPYPGLFCGGWLCGRGIPPQILLAIIAFAVILPCTPYEYILLVMHQKMIAKTTSRVRISKRLQNTIIVTIVLLLTINVVGFSLFGQRSKNANEILSRPELAWLAKKGQVFLFGDIDKPETFAFECYILSTTVALIMPYVWFFTFHSRRMVKKNQKALDSTCLQLQMTKALQYQFYGVVFCFALPCALLSLGSNFGSFFDESLPHPRVLAIGRFLFTILHNLYSLPFSLILILKTSVYRKILWNKIRRIFRCMNLRFANSVA